MGGARTRFWWSRVSLANIYNLQGLDVAGLLSGPQPSSKTLPNLSKFSLFFTDGTRDEGGQGSDASAWARTDLSGGREMLATRGDVTFPPHPFFAHDPHPPHPTSPPHPSSG